MLLRFETMFLRSRLAEVEELADQAAELREFAVLLVSKVRSARHVYIVPRYNYAGPLLARAVNLAQCHVHVAERLGAVARETGAVHDGESLGF